jgi:RNA polymerase sigma factor (sigma-70 family)
MAPKGHAICRELILVIQLLPWGGNIMMDKIRKVFESFEDFFSYFNRTQKKFLSYIKSKTNANKRIEFEAIFSKWCIRCIEVDVITKNDPVLYSKTIFKNELFMAWRKYYSSPFIPLNEEEQADRADTQRDFREILEENEYLRQRLSELSEEEIKILELYYGHDLTCREIAILGKTPGAVLKAKNRAEAKLRKKG